MYDVNVMTSDL